MVTREEIGRRIRRAREELSMTQGDLGRVMSRRRTHAAISDIELGKTKLNVDELLELATILQKDMTYFVGGSTEATSVQTSSSIVYRRGDRGLGPMEQRETDRSIEAFKRLAREKAMRRPGDPR